MPHRRFKSVLIVEDDIAIREGLKDAIEMQGYIVFMASNGVEALKKLDVLSEVSLPCLILTDLMMPKMDGYELTSRLSKDHVLAPIPVIVMSAHGNSMPPYRFVRKPFNLDDLLAQVDEAAADCKHEGRFHGPA
jgi:CheY-like chemotaxis protein